MRILRQSLWAIALAGTLAAQVYPNRWVYVSRALQRDSDVEEIRSIARTAAAHGLNGILLAAGFDRIDLQNEAYFRRLAEVREIAAGLSLEIIPLFYSAGYASGILSHNRNLAEGLPVRDALFIVDGDEARLVPDPPVAFANGGFEDYAGNSAPGYRFHDGPGITTFIDREVVHTGTASMRFENFTANPNGHGRVMQEIPVRPYRCYRVTAWVKAEQLQPASGFRIQVLSPEGRALAPWNPRLPSTTDWRKLEFGFNSGRYSTVRIYAGIWGGKAGKFWLDDLSIEEVGFVNVLRRDGTPIRVVAEGSGTLYEEGRDFAAISDPQLNYRFDHDAPPIRLLPGTRIRDGERLRVSYYHGMSINDGQVTACMSEPEVLDILRNVARIIHQVLAPRKWMLSMDEVRAGGTCEACKRSQRTMGQILGNFITQGFLMIRDLNPEAEVWTWSDMLDPNHNAHGDYYLVDGAFTGSWENIPSDLGIVCWYYPKRNESLAFFSGLGFRTLAGAYYDGDTLENPLGWLEALAKTPRATGIMYTTWQNKYDLLADFGDLVSRRAIIQRMAPPPKPSAKFR